jgi:hypothetical protein
VKRLHQSAAVLGLFFLVRCSYSIVTGLVGIEWPLNQASNVPLGGDSPTGSGAPSVAAVRIEVQMCHKEEPLKHISLYGGHYVENNRLQNQMQEGQYITVRGNRIINFARSFSRRRQVLPTYIKKKNCLLSKVVLILG